MGSRTSKIDFSDFILDGFDPKITFPPSIRVRNITFDRFLKIFGNYEHFKKNVEKMIFSPNIFKNRSKVMFLTQMDVEIVIFGSKPSRMKSEKCIFYVWEPIL